MTTTELERLRAIPAIATRRSDRETTLGRQSTMAEAVGAGASGLGGAYWRHARAEGRTALREAPGMGGGRGLGRGAGNTLGCSGHEPVAAGARVLAALGVRRAGGPGAPCGGRQVVQGVR